VVVTRTTIAKRVTGRRRPAIRSALAGWCVMLAATGLLAGCDSGDATSRVVATVFDQSVQCETADTCVVASSGEPATGERFDVAGVTSSGASRYDPGLYLYAGGFRANGVFFELELDVPAYLGAEVRDLSASYREYAGGDPLFASDAVGGEIQLVPLSGEDGPFAGIFDLRFIDYGRDDLRGTGDELVRTLRFGSFTLSGREPERPTRPIEVRPDDVYVDVQVDIYIEDPAFDYYSDGCDDSTPEGYNEGTGCEGDTSTDPGGGAGCEGDTVGDVGGGSGCEGDTPSDFDGGGGCAGDTGGGGEGCSSSPGSGGCEGDTFGTGSSARARPKGRTNRFFSAGLPLLALLLTRFVLRRR
jgi:hypothetical protein